MPFTTPIQQNPNSHLVLEQTGCTVAGVSAHVQIHQWRARLTVIPPFASSSSA